MADPVVSARLDALTSWHADWAGLRVAVLGLSATGFSAADTLTELGAEVLVLGESASEEYRRLVPVIGARLHLGPLQTVPDELIEFDPEVVVASPGFSPSHPVIQWAQASEAGLWGDVELAWRVRDKVQTPQGAPAPWLLVAGAEGVATTTRLAAGMLVTAGLRAAPCGDVGVPVLDAVRDPGGFDALVVALSSRQLWYLSLSARAGQIVPDSTVCLNVDDAQAEWHGSVEDYRAAQALVYRHTRVACVYDKADAAALQMVEEADVVEGARAIGFDLGSPGRSDLGVVDGILVDRAFLAERAHSALELTTLAQLGEAGLAEPESVRRVLAASALARSMGAPPAAIAHSLRSA